MITLLTGLVGERLARPVLIVGIIIALIGSLGVARCVMGGGAAKQAQQTTRSGEAIADAAKDAVATISNRSDTERSIDAATAIAKEEIGNAQNTADVRRAVVNALCLQPAYRNDPACAVR